MNHPNTEPVRYSSPHCNEQKVCNLNGLLFRPPFGLLPLVSQATFNHLNTRLVRNSDPHFTIILKKENTGHMIEKKLKLFFRFFKQSNKDALMNFADQIFQFLLIFLPPKNVLQIN